MGKKFKNKDLAAKLGVSGTLVSLVLNNKADQHGIRKDTQERVIALARQMGYFSAIAEKNEISPVEEKPGVIGMIVPSGCDHFVAAIAPYLQKAFASIGVGFSIVTKDANDQRFERLIGAFRKFFSGIILVGSAADDFSIRTLRSSDYPLVLLENNPTNLRLNTVCSDTASGTILVANLIRDLGYRNIAVLCDRGSSKDDASKLIELENSLSLIPEINKPQIVMLNLYNTDIISDHGALDEILRPPFRADVIITLQSNPVYPLMTLLRKKKMRVPHDVAIISMEEGTGFDLLYSPVTCLKKPYAAMASKVANMLWSEIRNSGKGKFKRQVNLPLELIVRSSCGNFISV
jgi:LacI family transcriptional regulator